MELRTLQFSSLDDIAKEVLSLKTSGYHRQGNWGLAAICDHLADWMTFPMDGFPKMSFPLRCLLSVMKNLQGKRMFRKILATKQLAKGAPTIPQTIHVDSNEEDTAVQRYLQSIERLKTFRGPIHSSPLFGEMTYDELVALQLIHAAHHLRFLEPEKT